MSESDIPEQYRLSFLIGEVVRADVGVELEVRALWANLRAAGFGPEKPGDSFGRVLSSVRRTFEDEAGIPGPYRELAEPVLEEVKSAHDRRNALAHDYWVQMPFRYDRARAARLQVTYELSALTDLVDELKGLLFRVRGLWILAGPWITGKADPADLTAEDLHMWTRVAMGHGTLQGHVVDATPGPATSPPRWSPQPLPHVDYMAIDVEPDDE